MTPSRAGPAMPALPRVLAAAADRCQSGGD